MGEAMMAQAGQVPVGADQVPVQMMTIGLLLLAGHLGGKICQRLGMSEVVGQLLGGVLVGPYALHLLGVLPGGEEGTYDHAVHGLHFFVFVFLSLIAFGIGEELHWKRVRKVGRSAATICLIQGGFTWLTITVGFFLFSGMSLVDSMLVGSIGIATAPAATVVLMNELNIEGRLRHMLANLVVLDDVMEVIVFSFLLQISLARAEAKTSIDLSVIVPVAAEIFFAALLGVGVYLMLHLLVRQRAVSLRPEAGQEGLGGEEHFLQRIFAERPSPSVSILIIIVGFLSLGTGLAYYNHWPFLITATLAGFLVANLHSQAIFDSLKIDNIPPVLNLAFFALVGANMSLPALGGRALWLIGLYLVTRLAGKIGGTWIGCKLMKEEPKIVACLPSLMLPQAGVAVVESIYAGMVLNRPDIPAVILPAVVFFQIVGVLLVDRGLRRWRSWVTDEEKEMQLRLATARPGPGEAARRLLSYVSEKNVAVDLCGDTRQEVIAELLDHALTTTSQHIDRTQALQVLAEREHLSPTSVGNGVALPHCRLMAVDEPVLVLGRHPGGVDFGGVDNRACDLFVFMLSSARNPREHLGLLSAATHVLGIESIREGLRSAGSPREFLDVLRKAGEEVHDEAEG
jgi:Kef-type K+ transport system membrane component KefB/mannitol/fructose-specific phosphotransferase system IIA component (Ntr-type)